QTHYSPAPPPQLPGIENPVFAPPSAPEHRTTAQSKCETLLTTLPTALSAFSLDFHIKAGAKLTVNEKAYDKALALTG
ncbi:hypothetical protein, partial [Corynebacterium striatum]|uniref:hypothetical protein n=1 Tax=Corynebacterium striatum TaxID=43770 RepID=UPI003F688DFB